MFALSLLGLLAFTMPIDDISGRVNTLLTLILTSVAFKFILAGALPKVPYNTLLDYYVLLSCGTLALNAFLSVVPLYLPQVMRSSPAVQPLLVNFVSAGVSGGMVLAVFGAWMLRARAVTRTQGATQTVAHEAGVNWYAFRFYPLAHYLN